MNRTRTAEPTKLSFGDDLKPPAVAFSVNETELKPSATDNKPFTFSPDLLQVASEEAAVPGNPSMIATVTKAMKNGTVILGVINIFDTQNPRTNRQFWGAKSNVILALVKMYANHCPGYADLQPFVDCLIPVTVLRNRYSRNQDSRLSRQGNSGQTFYDCAIGFVINSSGKVVTATSLLTTFLSKLLSMFRRSDFRTSYQSICDRQQSLKGFAESIREKNEFWLTWSRLSCVTDPDHLNKFLPDDEIIKLGSSVLGIDEPKTWPPEFQSECWKDGLPSELL